jgi:hypothetical protein
MKKQDTIEWIFNSYTLDISFAKSFFIGVINFFDSNCKQLFSSVNELMKL